MKRILLTILIASTTLASVSAQGIRDVLLTMPDGIIQGLDAVGREELVANTNDTVSVSVKRGQFGTAIRNAISADYIEIQTSEAGTTQIKLLPLINNTQIICVVKTVCAKVCDSQMQFYTTSWMPIPQDGLFPMMDKGWFIKADVDKNSQDFRNAYAALDMNPMKISLSPADGTLTVTYEIEKYLSEDDYKKIEPYLTKEPKVFSWDKSTFK